MPALGPAAPEVCALDDPPGEVDDGCKDRPDRELPYEAAHEAHRPEECEHRRDDAEQELPRPHRLEAEELVAEETGRRCDHDQLEDRPAQALQDVERRREIRAAASEWGPLQHHGRHARVRADQRGNGEHQVADHGPDERRCERVTQRQIEVGGQNEHQ